MNKEKIYNNCIKQLQEYEGLYYVNGYYQILENANNNIEYAIHTLKLVLIRTINDLYEGSKKDQVFYNSILNKISEICIY